MEKASFITTEDGDDLIVSFAIPIDEDWDVKSLTLLRTPKYEFALDESERGVNVSFDDFPDEEFDMLERVKIEGGMVTINTNHRTYTISIKNVKDVEIDKANVVLEKMNFDGRFELKIV